MNTEQRWAAVLEHVAVLRLAYTAPAASFNVRGRFITYLVAKLADFWGRHKDTLIPLLSDFAVAALEALAQARAEIQVVNPRGPE